jgi:hypothetical protein
LKATPHFQNLHDKVTFHKSQVNFIRFIVLPLYKELQEFNQVSLKIKYVHKEDKSQVQEGNVFAENKEDESIMERKEQSINSKDSVNVETQRLILKKSSYLQSFLDNLQYNYKRHEEILTEASK